MSLQGREESPCFIREYGDAQVVQKSRALEKTLANRKMSKEIEALKKQNDELREAVRLKDVSHRFGLCCLPAAFARGSLHRILCTSVIIDAFHFHGKLAKELKAASVKLSQFKEAAADENQPNTKNPL